MIIPIALGVFVFVVIAVAGWRALDLIDAARDRAEARRVAKVRALRDESRLPRRSA